MARRLASYVHMYDADGALHSFGPNDTVPAWAADRIDNPKAWGEGVEDAADLDPSATPPPSKAAPARKRAPRKAAPRKAVGTK